MYELIIIWSNGDRQIFSSYETMEEALKAEEGFHTAFGNQISWSGIRKIYP